MRAEIKMKKTYKGKAFVLLGLFLFIIIVFSAAVFIKIKLPASIKEVSKGKLGVSSGGELLPFLIDPVAPEKGFDYSQLPPAEVIPDTLIVKFKDLTVAESYTKIYSMERMYLEALSPEEEAARNQKLFPERAKRVPPGAEVPDLRTIYRLILKEEENVGDVKAKLEKDPNIVEVRRELIPQPTSVPDDSLYQYQWWLPKIGLTEVGQNSGWDIEKGSYEVRVANGAPGLYGFDPTHPDLQGLLPEGYQNFFSHTHETLVTGVVAANVNNNLGIAGENWQVKFFPMGGYPQTAVDLGADVVTISWEGNYLDDFAYYRSMGIVGVLAAANRNEEVRYQRNCDYGLVVAATDQNDRKASFSNWGDCIAIAAPGVRVLSTLPRDFGGYGLWASEGSFSLGIAPTGLPRIAYYEAAEQRLVFLSFDGSNWSREIVDEEGNSGLDVSLQIDGQNRPNLAYYEVSEDRLNYAYKDDTWHYETIAPSGKYSTLKLDPLGNPTVVYYQSGKLMFARRVSGSWQQETVDANGDVGGFPSLALAVYGAGELSYYISYYDYTNKALKFAEKQGQGGSWQTETVHDEGENTLVGYANSLMLSGNGQPAISYLKRGTVPGTSDTSDFLYFTVKGEAGWERELVYGGDSNYTYHFGKKQSLQFDGNGRPRIATLFVKYLGTTVVENDFRILSKSGNWGTVSTVAATTNYNNLPGYQSEYFYSPSREYVLYLISATGEVMFGQKDSFAPNWTKTKLGEINNPYAYASGTSFAAPMVAGAAALVIAQHPEYNVDQIREALMAGADDLVQEDVPVSGGGTINCGVGRDKCFGAGRVNIRKTLELGRTPTPVVPDEILLKFKSGTSEPSRDEILTRYRLERIATIPGINVEIMRVASKDREEVLEALNREASVEYAEPNFIAEATDTVPNDPYFSTNQWGPQKVQAPAAWDITTGSSSYRIAILDTGIRADHPDLAGKVIAGYDFVNDDADPSDDHGHGTHVAGIAAATTNNNIGVAGISWQSPILSVKVLNASASGYYSWIARGIIYAADQDAKIINLSLGGVPSSSVLEDAVNYAWNKGALIIAAAGNNANASILYPAKYPNALAVGATTITDTLWGLSNYGPELDITAPGAPVYSTYFDTINNLNTYRYMSGTSMATPHVSGATALLWAKEPTASQISISDALYKGADDLGDPGWDQYFGWGRLNIYQALSRISPPVNVIVQKDDGADPVNAGEDFSYTVAVANNTPSEASLPYVIDSLPAPFELVSVSGDRAGNTCTPDLSNDTFRCDLNRGLASGETWTITIGVSVPENVESEVYTNVVTVYSEANPGGIIDGEETTVRETADLVVTKTDDRDPVNAGENFIYTISLTNNGPSNADNVRLSDTLPDGFQVTRVSPSVGTCTFTPSNFSCNIGNLAKTQRATIDAEVFVLQNTTPDRYTNTVRVYSDENQGGVTANQETTVVRVPTFIVGRVILQGRTNYSGVTVKLEGPETIQLTTNAQGTFEQEVPPGRYRVSAIFPRYLEAVKENVEVTPGEREDIGETLLRGGDVAAPSDGRINIFDLVTVGVNYGRTVPPETSGDANGDGRIDIFDLTMVGVNFGSRAPQPWSSPTGQ